MKTSLIVFISALCLMGCSEHDGAAPATKDESQEIEVLNGQQIWRLTKIPKDIFFVCRAEQLDRKRVVYIVAKKNDDVKPSHYEQDRKGNIRSSTSYFGEVSIFFESALLENGKETLVELLVSRIRDKPRIDFQENVETKEIYSETYVTGFRMSNTNGHRKILDAPTSAHLDVLTPIECQF